MNVTCGQLRAARALLLLDQDALARRAHVSVATVRRLERSEGVPRVAADTVLGVARALEQAGAEFIPDGVRRRAEPARGDVYQRLQAISLRGAARLRNADILTDDDLYDENGLPA